MRLSLIALACRQIVWGGAIRPGPAHIVGLQLFGRAETMRTWEYGPPGLAGVLIHELGFRGREDFFG